MQTLNLVGQRFGKLTVLAPARRYAGNTNNRWKVRCDCGTVKTVFGMDLRAGRTRSCGCGTDEAFANRSRAHVRHGHSKRVGSKASRTYNTWVDMLRRCDPERAREEEYRYYAARGITVCKRWLKFENFLADMGKRPKNKALDRKNNDGNYTQSNCRWATHHQQRMNQRKRGTC